MKKDNTKTRKKFRVGANRVLSIVFALSLLVSALYIGPADTVLATDENKGKAWYDENKKIQWSYHIIDGKAEIWSMWDRNESEKK